MRLSGGIHDRPGDASAAPSAGLPQGAVLAAAATLPVMGSILLSPGLPQMLRQFQGQPGSALKIMIMLSGPALCIALLGPFIGPVIERYGRRKVLLSALAGYALLGTAPAVAPTLETIIALRLLLGVAEAAIIATVFSLIVDYFQGDQRNKWIAIENATIALAGLGFIYMGGLLANISWRMPFLSYGLAAGVFLAALLVIHEPARSAPASAKKPYGRTPLGRYFFVNCTVTMICSISFYFIPLQTDRLFDAYGVTRPATLGLLHALGSLGAPVGSYCFRFVGRWPCWQVLTASRLATGLATVAATMTHSPTLAVLCMFFAMLGSGLTYPALMADAMASMPADRAVNGGAIWYSAVFVGSFISPLIALGIFSAAGSIPIGFRWLGFIDLAFSVCVLVGSQVVTEKCSSGVPKSKCS